MIIHLGSLAWLVSLIFSILQFISLGAAFAGMFYVAYLFGRLAESSEQANRIISTRLAAMDKAIEEVKDVN